MEEKNWRSKKIIEHVLQILERKYDFLAIVGIEYMNTYYLGIDYMNIHTAMPWYVVCRWVVD